MGYQDARHGFLPGKLCVPGSGRFVRHYIKLSTLTWGSFVTKLGYRTNWTIAPQICCTWLTIIVIIRPVKLPMSPV